MEGGKGGSGKWAEGGGEGETCKQRHEPPPPSVQLLADVPSYEYPHSAAYAHHRRGLSCKGRATSVAFQVYMTMCVWLPIYEDGPIVVHFTQQPGKGHRASAEDLHGT